MNTSPPILIVTKNLPPDTGGMERLWFEGISGLSSFRKIIVVGPRHAHRHIKENCTFYPAPRFLPLFFIISFIQALRAVWKHKPSTVIAGSGVMAPVVYLLAKCTGIRCACYLHGLDIIYPNIVYQKLFLPCIRKIDIIFTNSTYTAQLAIDKNISNSKISIITPGVTMPVQSEPASHKKINPDNINLVFWGRIVKRKGLSRFIRECMPQLIKSNKHYHLNIIGASPDKKSSGEFSECQKVIQELNLTEHVTFWGRVSDSELSLLLQSMQLHIFPLIELEGNVEGFGMVALEAASYGIPTIAFNCGGVSNAIEANISGRLIEPGKYSEFTNAVLETQIEKTGCLQYAKNNSWNEFCKKINSCL